jgi:integral membrane protein
MGENRPVSDSTPQTTPATTSGAAPDPWVRKAAGATLRYRVLAWITGSMLLLLCLELILKYVFHAGGVDAAGHPNPVIGAWVAYAHGWIYVVYLVTVFDLWSKMRWRLGRLATMAAAGVVPVMSFILERKVHAQALARLEAVGGARG